MRMSNISLACSGAKRLLLGHLLSVHVSQVGEQNVLTLATWDVEPKVLYVLYVAAVTR